MDCGGGWFLVDAAFAAFFKFEVLDGVGDVDLFAVDAGLVEGLVEEAAGGSDEGAALLVFLIAGLFAD